MIKVTIKKNCKYLVGFEVMGHAFYDIEGKDIVCSAVSILTINTINTITEILKLTNKIEYKIGEDFISLNLLPQIKGRDLEDTQIILKSFELGISSLVSEYSENIILNYMEV